MNRSTLDRLISSTGLIVAIVLLLASGGLFYAYHFVHGEVHDQLAEQNISFPAAGTTALASLPDSDQSFVAKYAGQQLLTGAQAEVFADHYIAVHLRNVGGGKTYSELSAESMANPTDTALAGKVETLFKGEMLRGTLLNAYAFDTMGMIAYYAAIGALIAGIILFLLAGLGFNHATRITTGRRK